MNTRKTSLAKRTPCFGADLDELESQIVREHDQNPKVENKRGLSMHEKAVST